MAKPSLLKKHDAHSFDKAHVHDPKSGVVDYECVTPCTAGRNNRLFQVGERWAQFQPLAEGDVIPRHFRPIIRVQEEAVEPEVEEEPDDFPLASLKACTSWNRLIHTANTIAGLEVNRDLTFRKAKEDVIRRYLASQEE